MNIDGYHFREVEHILVSVNSLQIVQSGEFAYYNPCRHWRKVDVIDKARISILFNYSEVDFSPVKKKSVCNRKTSFRSVRRVDTSSISLSIKSRVTFGLGWI